MRLIARGQVSPEFQSAIGDVIESLRLWYPHDPRVRAALDAHPDPIILAPTASRQDIIAVEGKPVLPLGSTLIGAHFNDHSQLLIFEDGIKKAAAYHHWPLDYQIENTLLHELEHHYGFCPPGHPECVETEAADVPWIEVAGV